MVRPHARAASCAFALAVALALALALAACSAIVDFKGLAGPASGDAGDAGADARAADGATAGDGSVTSNADGGADGSVFECPEGGFCDDFDTPPLGATWTNVSVNGNISLFLDDGGSQSPPYAVRLTLPAQNDGLQRNAELQKDLPPGSSVTCRVDFRIDQAPSTGDATLVRISPTNDQFTQNDFFLTYNAGDIIGNEQWKFVDGGGKLVSKPFTPPPIGKWVRLTVITDYKSRTVMLDGTTIADAPFALPTTPTKLQVALGERYDTEPSASSVVFDNYACVVTP